MYIVIKMIRVIFFLAIILFKFSNLNAEVIESIKIDGNDRISNETIKIFSKVEIGNDLESQDLNNIIKELYSTNFFNIVSVKIKNKILIINVKENPLVQKITINGVKNKDLNKTILEKITVKEKNSFVDENVARDVEKISNFLKISGYYFSKINLDVDKNSNNTVNLIYNISLGERAVVSKIDFTGNKIYKKNTLSRVIVTEEDKFWKFLSKKKYLNEGQINLDQRLLKNFYLNEGYYKVKITQSTASIIKDNNFKLTYNINAGEKYYFNNLDLIVPSDYDLNNFKEIQLSIDEIKNTVYSHNKIEKLLNQIDKIAITKQFEFINASFEETLVEKNKINIKFIIDESKKLYVDRINIFGNDITNENAIRDLLIVDEGDPLNQILNNKSINNIQSSGLFSKVDYKIVDTENEFKKNIEINLVEQPTGEISAGAGFGSSGQTFSFGVKENNFRGNATKLNTNLSVSQTSIIGGVNISIPNYNYTDKSLKLNLSRSDNDYFDTSGYKNTITNVTVGTGFEYKQDLFFTPLAIFEIEDLETNSSASQSLRKQDGNYNNIKLDYSFLYDRRNQIFRPSEGFYSRFNQVLPIVSNDYSLFNSYDFKYYQKLSENMIGSLSYHLSAVNSLEGGEVRVSERINLPSRKIRGFKSGKIGPKDNNDYIGGNYASAMTLATTLPDFLPDLESVSFGLFFDAANVWGVDYNSSLDNSKIRSSTGLAIDWLTPIGPLNFVLAQPITKDSSDVEETFRFNIGTTF
tara:strand:- start:6693 stop:8945 length:2253 start_codon:yes stop_codon:yes gene_type:complete